MKRFNIKDAAAFIGIKEDSFRLFLERGMIPKGRKLGRETMKSGKETVWSIEILRKAKPKVEGYKRGDHITPRQRRNQAKCEERKLAKKDAEKRISQVFNNFMKINHSTLINTQRG